MHEEIFTEFSKHWPQLRFELFNYPLHELKNTSSKVKILLHKFICQNLLRSAALQLRYNFIRHRINSITQYISISTSIPEKQLSIKLIEELVSDIAYIYHFYGHYDDLDEGFIE